MLQNRVDPFGNIIQTSARGSWLGNRGVIHNDHKRITHAYKHKAWITCVLEFKGRSRVVMTPDRWTELFFLDEATAFAAGHRPCFECRREDAKRFKSFWIQGNPQYGFDMKTSIRNIDEVLHAERIDHGGRKGTHTRPRSGLQDGIFVAVEEQPFLFYKGQLKRWTPFGYEKAIDLPTVDLLTVLTPRSIVNAFRAGYMPEVNEG